MCCWGWAWRHWRAGGGGRTELGIQTPPFHHPQPPLDNTERVISGKPLAPSGGLRYSARALCKGAYVAQLVEQRFRKPQVIGSSPIVGSSFLVVLDGAVAVP